MAKLLIKNGLIFTGDKNKQAKVGDIFVVDGIIEKIPDTIISPDEDTLIIDATSLWATPGFIDTHTHYDAEVLASPGLKESARHGVTTIVLGSCSVSAIFNDAEDTSDSFTRVEAIPRSVMLPLMKARKSWNTPQGWVDYIEKSPLGINIASFIGHSDIRS